MPSNVTVPETLDLDDVVFPDDFVEPPQPAAMATSAATTPAAAAKRTARFLPSLELPLTLTLLSRFCVRCRSLGSCPRRRSGGRGCRPPPRPPPPPQLRRE